MIDAGLRISREAITKKRKQPFERLRFGGMVMSPEGMETIIGPHAVQIFKASLVMGVALDVVEEIARLRPREQVKAFAWLCRTQLEGGFAGFARVLQSGLADKLLRRRTRNAAHRAVMPSQRGHGFDAGRLELLHLAAGTIGDLEQDVLAGEDGVAMVGPSAQRTLSAGDRPRWHRGSTKGIELSPRTESLMGLVGPTEIEISQIGCSG